MGRKFLEGCNCHEYFGPSLGTRAVPSGELNHNNMKYTFVFRFCSNSLLFALPTARIRLGVEV